MSEVWNEDKLEWWDRKGCTRYGIRDAFITISIATFLSGVDVYATSTPHCCDRPSVGLKNKPFIPSQSETERGPERLRSINKQGS